MTDNQKRPSAKPAPTAAVRFRELVGWWAEELGHHHVPLQEHTTDIHGFLSPDAVHHDLIQSVVRNVYRANNCSHLDALITLEDTFTALGRTREGLLSSAAADIDQIDLLDNIGWHTRQYFASKSEPVEAAIAPAGDSGRRDAGVVSLPGVSAYR